MNLILSPVDWESEHFANRYAINNFPLAISEATGISLQLYGCGEAVELNSAYLHLGMITHPVYYLLRLWFPPKFTNRLKIR